MSTLGDVEPLFARRLETAASGARRVRALCVWGNDGRVVAASTARDAELDARFADDPSAGESHSVTSFGYGRAGARSAREFRRKQERAFRRYVATIDPRRRQRRPVHGSREQRPHRRAARTTSRRGPPRPADDNDADIAAAAGAVA